jgi:hypothetical protein
MILKRGQGDSYSRLSKFDQQASHFITVCTILTYTAGRFNLNDGDLCHCSCGHQDLGTKGTKRRCVNCAFEGRGEVCMKCSCCLRTIEWCVGLCNPSLQFFSSGIRFECPFCDNSKIAPVVSGKKNILTCERGHKQAWMKCVGGMGKVGCGKSCRSCKC